MKNIQPIEQQAVSDYIKILELSNFIDDWEQTVLFSQNGFYSLKGKAAEEKTKELLEVLERDSEKILSEENFKSPLSYQKAEEIKRNKINTIKEKMLAYEESEKLKYEIEITQKTIDASKDKAVSYKNYPEITEKCYLNALSAIGLQSQLLQASKEETNNLIKNFNSDFFESITKSFIDENSPEAKRFYSKNKTFIFEEKRENLEKAISQMEEKQSGFESAKEIFSKEINKSQAFKEVSEIKNENVRKFAKIYLENFFNSKENLEKEQKDKQNKARWEEIDACLEENSDSALSKIDLNADETEINAQISYIKTIIKKGEIETDDKKFFELYKCAFETPEKFPDIYNFKHCLNKEDFDYFLNLKPDKNEYYELKQHFEKSEDYNTLLIKTFNLEKKIFEKNANKQISLSQAAELIESVAARIKKWDLFRKRG